MTDENTNHRQYKLHNLFWRFALLVLSLSGMTCQSWSLKVMTLRQILLICLS